MTNEIRAFFIVCCVLFATICSAQNIGSGSLDFPRESAVFNASSVAKLKSLGNEMKSEPLTGVIIWGGTGGTKISQQVSWVRADQMIRYMSDNLGIDRSRFYYSPMQGVPENALEFKASDNEDAPQLGPPPYPSFHVAKGID